MGTRGFWSEVAWSNYKKCKLLISYRRISWKLKKTIFKSSFKIKKMWIKFVVVTFVCGKVYLGLTRIISTLLYEYWLCLRHKIAFALLQSYNLVPTLLLFPCQYIGIVSNYFLFNFSNNCVLDRGSLMFDIFNVMSRAQFYIDRIFNNACDTSTSVNFTHFQNLWYLWMCGVIFKILIAL